MRFDLPLWCGRTLMSVAAAMVSLAVTPGATLAAEAFGPVEPLKFDAKKAELGKRLFYDVRLSGDSAISWPLSTRSPIPTSGWAGSPTCWSIGRISCSGSGGVCIGRPVDSDLCAVRRSPPCSLPRSYVAAGPGTTTPAS